MILLLLLRRLLRPWNWAAAWWPRPYSNLTGPVPLRTGLTMVEQRSWVHVRSVISRGCVSEIDAWVLPALLQRLKGWGVMPVSAQTIRRTLHQIGLHGCCPRRKPLLKIIHKKVHKQFAEDNQTKDIDYWNHVLWSDETKINVFVSDGFKHATPLVSLNHSVQVLFNIGKLTRCENTLKYWLKPLLKITILL